MSHEVKHKETTSGNTANLSFVLGPSEDDAILFDSTIQVLNDYFDKAVSLGFRIVRFPRIAGVVNPDVDKAMYKVSDFHKYYELACEVCEKIEKSGSGILWLQDIGEKYDNYWFKGIKKSPDTECNHIAKAAAEWVTS